MTPPLLIKPSEQDDLYACLTTHMRPKLIEALEEAGEGQRLRVTTLPEPVMDRVCELFQGNTRWVAKVLSAGPSPVPWRATATKLIELRNSLKQPLLVFIPPGLRTAAEDSLDIATFTELSLSTLAPQLVSELLDEVPEPLQDVLRSELSFLRTEKQIRNVDETIDYLLTVLKNGGTPEAAGGALYTFGLLPDFALFTRGSPRYWLSRNLRVSDKLTDGHPLQTSLIRLPVKPSTIQPALFAFLRNRRVADIRSWAREIACQADHRMLSLDHWEFADEGSPESLRLIVDPLSLPPQPEDTVSGAARLPVLNLDGKDPLKVAFRAVPPPAQVANWKTWRVQIFSVRDGVPASAWQSNGFLKPAKSAKSTRNIKVQELQTLEEGTYFLRVDAYDNDGVLLTESRRVDEGDPNSRAENESDRFLVVRGNVVVEDKDIRAVFVSSLLDAWVQYSTRLLSKGTKEELLERDKLRGQWDEPIGTLPKGDVHFELKTEGVAGFSILVPSMLRKLELEILAHPDQLGFLRLTFEDGRRTSDLEIKRRDLPPFVQTGPVVAFLEARRAVFQAISQHMLKREGDEKEDRALRTSLVETVDLAPYATLIEAYARAYVELAKAARTSDAPGEARAALVNMLAQMDAVDMRWRSAPSDPGRAIVIAPTHPLRLLWHLQHTFLCQEAVRAWADGTGKVPDWRAFLGQLREDILPMNLPMVVFDHRFRGYVEHTPLTQFWPLYLPDRADRDAQIDGVAARDRVLRFLGIRDRTVAVTTVDTADVAARLYDYVTQHPYVEQLRINVFNPGDGRLIADVLRAIEQKRLADMGADAPSLRYAVHLFATEDHLESTGEGLESLLDPERQVGEDDEFTLAASNHLLPKLVFARNSLQEFLQAPERFSAHASLLLEQFVVQSRVSSVEAMRRGSFVGGLVQEPDTQVDYQTGTHFGWVRGLQPLARNLASTRELALRDAVAAAQDVQASRALGVPVDGHRAPVVALQLDPAGRSLLKQVHEVSDWVLTIDRNLGLDYFDSPASSRETGYLLDFAPEYLQEDRQRILLTTRSTVELETLVRPAMDRYGLTMRTGDEVLIVETLRSLSGRLAMRLETSKSQAAEVVGLLLARWLLERAGLLEQRVVIPLDAHRSWFSQGTDTSQRRADLLLVGFSEPNTLRLDIVEVKLREELTEKGRAELYADMKQQTQSTEENLRQLFAPDLYPEPRADALLRSKELTSALSFYIQRAKRYSLLSEEEVQRAFRVLATLDDGYQLDMRSLGVLFEHKSLGTHVDEQEPGFVVHRFGGDRARQLLAHAAGRLVERMSRSSEHPGSTRPPPPPATGDMALAAELRDEHIDSFREALSVRQGLKTPAAYSVRSPKPLTVSEPIVSVAKAPSPDEATLPSTGVTPNLPPVSASPHVVPEPSPAAPPAPALGIQPHAVPQGSPAQPAINTDQLPTHLVPDFLVGASEPTAQFGILGKSGSQKVAIDLNGCNTISLFGVQGFGKSYTLGVIAEMASLPVAGINVLPSPLATVFFHYHKSDAYEPEYASAVSPNKKLGEIERLAKDYGAQPAGLQDVVILTPDAKVEQRREEYPSVEVRPIKFASSEIGADGWKFLMGAVGNDSLYVKQIVGIMQRCRGKLTLARLKEELEDAELAKGMKKLADARISLAETYIDDTTKLGDTLRPGRTVIVDLRDEWLEQDDALGLFVVMMTIFGATKHQGKSFNKLMVFDEAHKYITESELIGQVVGIIREMRHQATSVVIASQDPISVPRAVIELSTVLVMHRMTSPQWLKHLKSAVVSLEDIEEGHLKTLLPGEALVWAQRSTDKRFMLKPQKVQIRPRFTQHGGGTKTAVSGSTIR